MAVMNNALDVSLGKARLLAWDRQEIQSIGKLYSWLGFYVLSFSLSQSFSISCLGFTCSGSFPKVNALSLFTGDAFCRAFTHTRPHSLAHSLTGSLSLWLCPFLCSWPSGVPVMLFPITYFRCEAYFQAV